jgi:hypothetical protein
VTGVEFSWDEDINEGGSQLPDDPGRRIVADRLTAKPPAVVRPGDWLRPGGRRTRAVRA